MTIPVFLIEVCFGHVIAIRALLLARKEQTSGLKDDFIITNKMYCLLYDIYYLKAKAHYID